MGWADGVWGRAAAPTYPCLIDERHVVAERFGMVNVPMAVWIDEAGRIVRPAEPAGASEGFRSINLETFEMPADVVAAGKDLRSAYVDAIRDWVERGEASGHVFAPDEVLRRSPGSGVSPRRQSGDAEDRLAAANFRLAAHLFQAGDPEAAKPYFAEAARLRPESWAFRRQAMQLAAPEAYGELAAGPEFWEAVAALGQEWYYPPIEMEGLPG